jgi:D-tyrosyl-tRNA(Tyr) deacylase
MIAVVQRVSKASVTVHGRAVGAIGHGLLALVAVQRDDTDVQLLWMAEKLVNLRIFRSEDGSKHFERDVKQVGGSILLVSNFTVAAATRKGRRPSLDGAADPARGRELFDQFVAIVQAQGVQVATGEFGADMIVSIENDGPATFIVETDAGVT